MKPRLGSAMSFSLWRHLQHPLSRTPSLCGCQKVNLKAITTSWAVNPFVSCSRHFATAPDPKNSYDLIVIGGGTGGLACAKEASQYGIKACVLDYVEPSPKGTTWGLGGTCTNVGCIPKKLYHEAALLRQSIDFAAAYGWQVPGAENGIKVDWSQLVQKIQQHVKSINWGYRVQLSSKKVKYINAAGSFVGPNLVKARTAKGEETILHGKNIVIAVGGRPNYLGIEGDVESCITSDDVFSLSENPGKTLVVGGGYIALETAGFLRGLGIDATVMYRSVALREFDQQMANLVVREMEEEGVTFLKKCKPIKFKKNADGSVEAYWTNADGSTEVDKFKTVMLAVGRRPVTDKLNLEAAGVQYDKKSGKIKCIDGTERTNVGHIYAVGDVMEGRPELTPVASKAGRFLAERLFSGAGDDGPFMNYDVVPTTVFTPLEYGTSGLSEEKAIEVYGEDKIEVYHAFYKPLSYYIPEKGADNCYVKLVCLREEPQKVVGLHFTGPNAGEIVQGFAIAMEGGLTKKQIDRSIGIHPTVAEEFVRALVTKRSGENAQMTAC